MKSLIKNILEYRQGEMDFGYLTIASSQRQKIENRDELVRCVENGEYYKYTRGMRKYINNLYSVRNTLPPGLKVEYYLSSGNVVVSLHGIIGFWVVAWFDGAGLYMIYEEEKSVPQGFIYWRRENDFDEDGLAVKILYPEQLAERLNMLYEKHGIRVRYPFK